MQSTIFNCAALHYPSRAVATGLVMSLKERLSLGFLSHEFVVILTRFLTGRVLI